ncbi:hypothetical protein BKA57DRAFT_234864 [Linnemannia elongata]|nr:hypothetical protein BKA57DRAFT_234864 [Linnemannia elongata]
MCASLGLCLGPLTGLLQSTAGLAMERKGQDTFYTKGCILRLMENLPSNDSLQCRPSRVRTAPPGVGGVDARSQMQQIPTPQEAGGSFARALTMANIDEFFRDRVAVERECKILKNSSRYLGLGV